MNNFLNILKRLVFFTISLIAFFSCEKAKEDEIIEITELGLELETLSVDVETIKTLTIKILPENATNVNLWWASSNEKVATVDQDGVLKAIAVGETIIKVSTINGEIFDECKVIVQPKPVFYIDEYGVNHGEGITIDDLVWAPVNCGYHETDYPYGKYYQWGRKMGHGFKGTDNKEEEDATYPSEEAGTILGPIDYAAEPFDDTFYKGTYEEGYQWMKNNGNSFAFDGSSNWNYFTRYGEKVTNPCPEGWFVPSYNDYIVLIKNSSSFTECEGVNGIYYTGKKPYSSDLEAKVFLPAAGSYDSEGKAYDRGEWGRYWSCASNDVDAYYLRFDDKYSYMESYFRACAQPIRCVRDKNNY